MLRPDAAPITESFSKIDVNEKDYLKMGDNSGPASEKEEEKSICFFTKNKKPESKLHHKEMLGILEILDIDDWEWKKLFIKASRHFRNYPDGKIQNGYIPFSLIVNRNELANICKKHLI